MPNIQSGARLGEWDSRFGKAEITAGEKIGAGYSDQLEAHKAIVKAGKQGAIVREESGKFSAYAVNDGASLDDLNLGEKVTGKAQAVVDFVGSDGASLEGGKYVEAPIGKDNGQVVHFMRALDIPNKSIIGRAMDTVLSTPNRFLQTDEKALLRAKGYTVVVDNTATALDITSALYDSRTSGLVYLGHGGGGKLATAGTGSVFNPKWLGPQNIDPARVSPNLRMAYFQACQTGKQQAAWQAALGPNTEIVSWSRNATNLDVMLANSGPNVFSTSVAGVLNPYVWMGETLSQTINRNLD